MQLPSQKPFILERPAEWRMYDNIYISSFYPIVRRVDVFCCPQVSQETVSTWDWLLEDAVHRDKVLPSPSDTSVSVCPRIKEEVHWGLGSFTR